MRALGRHPIWASKTVLQAGMAKLGPHKRPADRGGCWVEAVTSHGEDSLVLFRSDSSPNAKVS